MADVPRARQTWADLHGGVYEEGSVPPWDIGHPQPAFLALARAGHLRGRVLDIGCGTGEHALMAAELGLEATGIDSSPRAIALARQLDCGLFHVFDDDDRAIFVRNLTATVGAGGHYFMLCFSDQQPGDWGPRRVSRTEIESSFAEGWRIHSIEQSTLEITIDPEGARAWLVSATRT